MDETEELTDEMAQRVEEIIENFPDIPYDLRGFYIRGILKQLSAAEVVYLIALLAYPVNAEG